MLETTPFRIVNIYAQTDKRAESIIVGSRAGLETLKQAIELALSHKESSCRVAPSDLETYDVRIIVNNESLDSLFWSEMKLPYSDLDDNSKDKKSPHNYLDFGVRDSESLRRKEAIMVAYKETEAYKSISGL